MRERDTHTHTQPGDMLFTRVFTRAHPGPRHATVCRPGLIQSQAHHDDTLLDLANSSILQLQRLSPQLEELLRVDVKCPAVGSTIESCVNVGGDSSKVAMAPMACLRWLTMLLDAVPAGASLAS